MWNLIVIVKVISMGIAITSMPMDTLELCKEAESVIHSQKSKYTKTVTFCVQIK